MRAGTVALLVATAGVLVWSGPGPCGVAPAAGGAASPSGAPDLGAAPDPAAARAASPSGPAEPGAALDPVVPESGASERARRAVPPGTVGVPLRLAEPAALAVIDPGSRVDVLRVDDSGRSARVADAALVLGVTDADDVVTAGLLVALTPAEAERVVAHSGRGFAVLLRPD